MRTLFDKTFFKFLFGFLAVLIVSFFIISLARPSQPIGQLPLRAENAPASSK